MDGLLDEGSLKYICYTMCCLLIIVGSIFLLLGYSVLEATEYGLDYSWISKNVEKKVYENGLHFLGVGHSFIRFPKMVQTIEFSKERSANQGPVQSRTLDGLEVVLEISFQYTLDPSQLFLLYNRFGLNYQQIFQNTAIDILTEETTKYTAYEFFWDRGRIKDDFQRNLNEGFNRMCYSYIQFLQLRSVDLPNAFEDAIQESEVKKQDIKKAEAELNKVKVEVDTRIKSAEFQKNVTINIAEGEASAILQQNQAVIDSLSKVQASQSEGYKILKNKLAMTNDDLLKFIKSKLIKNYDGNNMALTITSPEPEKK